MRPLDQLNPEVAKPARYASAGALVPVVLGAIGLALADGAAPSVPIERNPMSLLSGGTMVAALTVLVVSRLFHWGWEAKFLGAAMFHLSSLSLLFVVPCLSLAIYSELPTLGLVVTIAALFVHAWWCRRFLKFYDEIFKDENAVALLYEEDPDAVYYMQRVDRHFIDKKFRFQQIPSQRYFVLFLALGLSLVPLMGRVTELIGLPFAHIFLLVGSLPMSLMAAGLCTRAWLVFIRYPARIEKQTKKTVYVDMSSGKTPRS